MDTQIAIPYADGQIFPHLGKAAQFKIYKIEGAVPTTEARKGGGAWRIGS